MKDELMHFLENHSVFRHELDAGSEDQVIRALEEFFFHYENKSLPKYLCPTCKNEHFMGYVCPIQQIQARCF